ncbi:MAG: sugar phosphate isomerase/epimerase, partial [Bacteroidetes bacterium]|nr:sugar phosphate isomerase/epimerase [Bacteroidota bacterium]
MSRIPIALQLYSIREECKNNLAEALRKVAEMGYDGVEFAGFFEHKAKDVKKMLDDNGLKVAGSHLGIPTMLGDEFEKTVAYQAEIGSKYPIIPGLPKEYTENLAAWKKTADIFNELAAKLKKHGMFTGYHNHHTEFTPVEGKKPWDFFFDNTCRDVVMQIDTGNALHGGADPLPYLEKYAGRARTVHLKEFSSKIAEPVIGQGEVKWKKFFKLCETVG